MSNERKKKFEEGLREGIGTSDLESQKRWRDFGHDEMVTERCQIQIDAAKRRREEEKREFDVWSKE